MIVVGMTSRGILGELVHTNTSHHILRDAARPVVAVPVLANTRDR